MRNIDFLFCIQAAVPKSMQLQLDPPSSSTIPSGGSVTQQMIVNNPNNAPLRLVHITKVFSVIFILCNDTHFLPWCKGELNISVEEAAYNYYTKKFQERLCRKIDHTCTTFLQKAIK